MRTRWTFGLVALLGLAAVLAARPVPLESLAGSYYYGDGLGVNRMISIDPEGTYNYIWRGCLGVYATAYGRITLDAGGVAVLGPAEEGGEGGLSLRLRVVRWGERTYLVPEDELLEFANEINHGDEPRSGAHGSFYLREDDWERPATGAPDLPAAYADLILAAPVRGKVLGKKKGASDSFEIDLGTRDGLKPGMELYSFGKRILLCNLTVVSVSEESSVVQGDETCRNLRAGMNVCSRFEGCPH